MKPTKLLFIFLLSALILAACAPSPTSNVVNTPEENTSDMEIENTSIPENNADEAAEPGSATEENAPAPTQAANPSAVDDAPRGAQREFSTDFSKRAVSFDEILSGGPPKDGIPSIDNPKFVSIQDADKWIDDVEPVIQVAINDQVKAYPLQILTWHEIVNDTVGDVPVVVSFCPLCNTAIAFERTVEGQVLDFGTTGRLRFSNLIMYDRQTETWWQQATGEAIVGELTGAQLEFVPAALISWEEYKRANPGTLVLSRETGFNRSYGQNPYIGYDDINQSPFLYDGPETPGELPATARVLAVEINNDTVAYPFDLLQEVHVVNDTVGKQEVAVFWTSGTASALDTNSIAEGRDVGSAVAYSRRLGDRLLTFSFDGQEIVDEETNSTWNIQGQATDGSLSGESLEEVVSVNHFWFSWAAFKPETRIYQSNQ